MIAYYAGTKIQVPWLLHPIQCVSPQSAPQMSPVFSLLEKHYWTDSKMLRRYNFRQKSWWELYSSLELCRISTCVSALYPEDAGLMLRCGKEGKTSLKNWRLSLAQTGKHISWKEEVKWRRWGVGRGVASQPVQLSPICLPSCHSLISMASESVPFGSGIKLVMVSWHQWPFKEQLFSTMKLQFCHRQRCPSTMGEAF